MQKLSCSLFDIYLGVLTGGVETKSPARAGRLHVTILACLYIRISERRDTYRDSIEDQSRRHQRSIYGAYLVFTHRYKSFIAEAGYR